MLIFPQSRENGFPTAIALASNNLPCVHCYYLLKGNTEIREQSDIKIQRVSDWQFENEGGSFCHNLTLKPTGGYRQCTLVSLSLSLSVGASQSLLLPRQPFILLLVVYTRLVHMIRNIMTHAQRVHWSRCERQATSQLPSPRVSPSTHRQGTRPQLWPCTVSFGPEFTLKCIVIAQFLEHLTGEHWIWREKERVRKRERRKEWNRIDETSA